MIIDILHNKIVSETMTEAFKRSFENVLVPMIEEKYGDSVERIVMYEDHIADGFMYEGEWYYPLSVKLEGEDNIIVWIKWAMNKKKFAGMVPYAYIGDEDIEFELAGFVPAGFADKLASRSIDYDRDAIKLTVEAAVDNITSLSGKYSQTFIDNMAARITEVLCRTLGVEDFKSSTIELKLVFAPSTYLEHTSENVTYRRLLMTDKGCQPRDFWVKWTRLDEDGAYKISDHIAGDEIDFEIGEDASQKIREKEYRFLASANPSKYQAAMGKKTVTEWRDITKRAIRRGDLLRTFSDIEIAEHAGDVADKLKNLLAGYDTSNIPVVDEKPVVNNDDIFEQLRSVLGETVSDEADKATEDSAEPETEIIAEPEAEIIAEPEAEIIETPTVEGYRDVFAILRDEEDEPAAKHIDVDYGDDLVPSMKYEFNEGATPPAVADEINAESVFDLSEDEKAVPVDMFIPSFAPIGGGLSGADITYDEYEEQVATAEPITQAENKTIDEAALRLEIEAKIRLEMETEMRLRAEREAEALRLERERLLEENERLNRLTREAELARIAEEKARREEEERKQREAEQKRLEEEAKQRELEEKRAMEARIRAEMEEKLRLEAKERERVAEAARIAVEEQKRLEAERAEREARERQEAFEREAERLRREEEARRAQEERRLAELRRLEEEARRRREEEEARARVQIVTKQAKLMFRYSVDLNVIKRIKSVVEETLIQHKKEKLNISIKAHPLDSTSIALEIQIPQNEQDLLVSMMKALGGASLGITKIVVE